MLFEQRPAPRSAGFFCSSQNDGAGSPSASRLRSRSRCGARAGGCHPRGHDCGDPLAKGRPKAAVYLLPCGPGRAPTGGFRRDSCRAKTAGRPGRPPDGPCPVEALAYATGPEGETRRLFRLLRFVGANAPLALRGATVLSSAIRTTQATRATPRRGMHRAMQTSARTHSTDAVPRGSDKRLRRQQLQRHWPRKGGDRQQQKRSASC